MPKPDSYQLLKDTYAAVGRLEEKMDRQFDAVNERVENDEKRISSLEGFKYKIAGAVSLVLFVGSMVGGVVSDWIFKKIGIHS